MEEANSWTKVATYHWSLIALSDLASLLRDQLAFWYSLIDVPCNTCPPLQSISSLVCFDLHEFHARFTDKSGPFRPKRYEDKTLNLHVYFYSLAIFRWAQVFQPFLLSRLAILSRLNTNAPDMDHSDEYDANMWPPGTVRIENIRRSKGDDVILSPQPTDDPNDPLNWPKLRR